MADSSSGRLALSSLSFHVIKCRSYTVYYFFTGGVYMKNKNLKALIFLLPLILTSIAILIFIPFKQALLIEHSHNEEMLAYIPLTKDHTFKIKYTHSIHLSDVVESYDVTEQQEIRLYEMMYEDLAIGMPENAGEGESFEHKNGKYYLKNMNRIFPFFHLRVGQVRANHTLIYNGEPFMFSSFVEPGTVVRVRAEKINFLQQMKGVNILE